MVSLNKLEFVDHLKMVLIINYANYAIIQDLKLGFEVGSLTIINLNCGFM